MLEVKFYDTVDDALLKFAVIISQSKGKWVMCKHKERDTFEVPGGHREDGESILETAKRELQEETGAVKFDIKPICVYSVTGKTRVNDTGGETFGLLCFAEISEFSGELHSEMEKVVLMDELPENWTYPLIQPKLIEKYLQTIKMKVRMLLFDLDGTLLQTDKTISKVTMQTLKKCREQGIMIGVSTSRSEKNALDFIEELNPDIVISSAGALVKYKNTYIYKAEFTQAETKVLIKKARKICGEECEITIDTVDAHYWNYKVDPKQQDKSWGDSVYTDFNDFNLASLKMCVEIFDDKLAEELQQNLPQCDCVRFSDGLWYKFTKKTATKENAILHMCKACEISTDDIVAFGDDFADIGMLKLCGVGVAMGNAIDEVKAIADCVIGDNDNDGIGKYLLDTILERN